MTPERLSRLTGLLKKSGTTEFHQRVVITLALIPPGKVASYGQIARIAGYPGYARQVVWTLHSSSKRYGLPWHRILNSQGKIGLQDPQSRLKQKNLLAREGIEVDFGKVDLKRHAWAPKAQDLKKQWRKSRSKKKANTPE